MSYRQVVEAGLEDLLSFIVAAQFHIEYCLCGKGTIEKIDVF
jgi:hypothetical protein